MPSPLRVDIFLVSPRIQDMLIFHIFSFATILLLRCLCLAEPAELEHNVLEVRSPLTTKDQDGRPAANGE